MNFLQYFLEGMEYIMQDSILFYFQVFFLPPTISWEIPFIFMQA